MLVRPNPVPWSASAEFQVAMAEIQRSRSSLWQGFIRGSIFSHYMPPLSSFNNVSLQQNSHANMCLDARLVGNRARISGAVCISQKSMVAELWQRVDAWSFRVKLASAEVEAQKPQRYNLGPYPTTPLSLFPGCGYMNIYIINFTPGHRTQSMLRALAYTS